MQNVFTSLRTAFSVLLSHPASLAIWVLGSLAFLLASFWAKTGWFVSSVLPGDWLTGSQKIHYLVSTVGLVVRSDVTASVLMLVTALLFGAALALYLFVIRRQRLGRFGPVYPLGGFLSALLGFGCAACGPLFLSLLGLGAAVSLLPLRGLEFTLLASLLLAISLLRSARSLDAAACHLHRIPKA